MDSSLPAPCTCPAHPQVSGTKARGAHGCLRDPHTIASCAAARAPGPFTTSPFPTPWGRPAANHGEPVACAADPGKGASNAGCAQSGTPAPPAR